jgi:hypothetical protein
MKIVNKETLLVDHLEGELDQWLNEDLKLLLEEDPKLTSDLKALSATRNLVAGTGFVAMPQDEIYFDNLHSKIMSKVEASSVSKRASGWSGPMLFEVPHLRFAASFAFFVLVGWSALNFLDDRRLAPDGLVGSQMGQVASADSLLIETTAQDPQAFADGVFAVDPGSELVLDAAVLKLENLPESAAGEAIDSIME